MLSELPVVISLIVFLFSYRLSVFLTRKVKEEALAGKWVDSPNERSSHKEPIPRVGGLAIVRTFYAGVFLSWALNGFRLTDVEMETICHPVVLIGGGMMCLVGLHDDQKGMSPAWKFFWQFLVAIVTVGFGVQFESGFMDNHGLGWVMKVLSVIWIVGIINALNLVDGLDGLAAGIAIIAACFLIAAQMIGGGVPYLFSGMVFLGALIGFLVFNSHPASIFMGDCGSMFLGYFLAVFSLPMRIDSENYYLVLVPICALGLPIFDTLSAMFRRILEGKSPFSADKKHLHHRIHSINRTKSGPYRRTIYSLYIISIAFGSFALVASVGKANWIGGIVVCLLCFVGLILYRYDYFVAAQALRNWLIPWAEPFAGERIQDVTETPKGLKEEGKTCEGQPEDVLNSSRKAGKN